MSDIAQPKGDFVEFVAVSVENFVNKVFRVEKLHNLAGVEGVLGFLRETGFTLFKEVFWVGVVWVG